MINKKIIFIHIPKTAGTSIIKYCQNNFSIYDGWDIKVKLLEKFNTDSSYINTHDFTKTNDIEKLSSYNKFTVVRNPYDRMVSWYFYITLFDKDKITKTFKEWIIDPLDNDFTPKEIDEKDFNSQCSFVDDTTNIIKYENLNEELSNFFGKKIILPIKNKTNHKHYLDYYDQETLDIVYKKYKKDFKKFNYKKI